MSSDTVAVITDIHGNLPALQSALERIDELGIERVYCGGDLVGYGPHPPDVGRGPVARRRGPAAASLDDYRTPEHIDGR